ncbi:MAG TPA: hypothetical protein VNJ51_10445 [Candidatus Dormibacteraeota bacterium]|nr:hypothetical protein [Candidatus Dormibacteraeota bacterium]
MQLLTTIDRATLERAKPLAESNEFAIYQLENDTYSLVHRHAGVEWQAITLSGDGIFRVSELLAQAGRALYRDLAGDLSKARKT